MIATMMIPVGDDCFPQTNRVTTQRKIIIFIVRRYKYYFRSLLFFIFFIFFVHQHGENFLLMQYVWYIFLSLHLFLFYSYWYFSPSAVYSPFSDFYLFLFVCDPRLSISSCLRPPVASCYRSSVLPRSNYNYCLSPSRPFFHLPPRSPHLLPEVLSFLVVPPRKKTPLIATNFPLRHY